MGLQKQLTLFASVFMFILSIIVFFSLMIYNKNTLENSQFQSAKEFAMMIDYKLVEPQKDISKFESEVLLLLDKTSFKKVTIYDNKNNPFFISSSKSVSTPSWFGFFYSPEAFNASSERIVANFNKYSKVVVQTDPSFLQEKLYKFCLWLMLSIFLFFVIFELTIKFFLQKLFNPLKAIDTQLSLITNNEFHTIHEKMSIKEFKNIVTCINILVKKLRNIYANEVEIFRNYNRQLFTDQELHVGNRAFMLLKLENYLKHSFGFLVFIEILNKNEIKKSLGYTKFIALHTFILDTINNYLERDAIVAKTNENTLSVLIPFIQYDEFQKRLMYFYDVINNHAKTMYEGVYIEFAIGVSEYKEQSKSSELFALTNKNLELAKQNATQKIYLPEDTQNLSDADKNIYCTNILTSTNIKSEEKIIYDFENSRVRMNELNIFMGIDGSTQMKSQSYIMGIIKPKERKKLQENILEHVFSNIKETSIKKHLSISLVHEFAEDSDCITWLINALRAKYKKGYVKFYFECDNHYIYPKRTEYKNLADKLRSCGHEFSILGYGFENNNFDYLKVLRPAYIKISKSYIINDIYNISKDVLENIAISLGACVHISEVSSKEEFVALNNLHVQFMQGEYIDKNR